MIVSFYILPNSSENKICGNHNGEIKIKLRAKPIEGEANAAIVEFLSEVLSIPKRQITIKRGELSRHKQVMFDVDKDEGLRIMQMLSNIAI